MCIRDRTGIETERETEAVEERRVSIPSAIVDRDARTATWSRHRRVSVNDHVPQLAQHQFHCPVVPVRRIGFPLGTAERDRGPDGGVGRNADSSRNDNWEIVRLTGLVGVFAGVSFAGVVPPAFPFGLSFLSVLLAVRAAFL